MRTCTLSERTNNRERRLVGFGRFVPQFER